MMQCEFGAITHILFDPAGFKSNAHSAPTEEMYYTVLITITFDAVGTHPVPQAATKTRIE